MLLLASRLHTLLGHTIWRRSTSSNININGGSYKGLDPYIHFTVQLLLHVTLFTATLHCSTLVYTNTFHKNQINLPPTREYPIKVSSAHLTTSLAGRVPT